MKVTLLGSVINTIDIQSSPYRKSYVQIILKPISDAKANSFKAFFLSKLHNYSPEMLDEPPTIYYLDTVHAREVMSILFQNNFISVEDRSNIEESIQYAEKDIKLSHQLTSQPKKSPPELLEYMSSPWVEEILNCPGTPNLILKLLIYPLCRYFNGGYVQDDLIQDLKTIPTQKKDEIIDVLGSINKICEGRAGLESSYTRIAGELPDIKSQRQAVAKYFISSYLKKFPNLPILEKFYATTQLWMMSDIQQSLMYLNFLKEGLISSLKNPSSREVWRTFKPLGGLYETIKSGIMHASFSNEELVSLRKRLSFTYPHMGFNDPSQWLILYPSQPKEEKLKVVEPSAENPHRFLAVPKTTWCTKNLKKELTSIFPEYKWKANATKNEARVIFSNKPKRKEALSEVREMLNSMQPKSNITIKKLKHKNGKCTLKLCNVTPDEIQKLKDLKESKLSQSVSASASV